MSLLVIRWWLCFAVSCPLVSGLPVFVCDLSPASTRRQSQTGRAILAEKNCGGLFHVFPSTNIYHVTGEVETYALVLPILF